jgi:hypothetical protein
MRGGNDLRTQRDRGAILDGSLDRSLFGEARGSSAILVTTTTVTTYPVAAGAFYAANPTEIDGAESEGTAATYTPDTTTVLYVLNVGTQIPPAGTQVVAHLVGGRNVFRYDG